MDHDEYAKQRGINATSIKAGRLSMKHMRQIMTGEPPVEESPAMRWGRLVHLAVLEPDMISRKMFIFDGRRAGNEWGSVCQDHDPRWIVKTAELAELMAMSVSVHSNTDAHHLIDTTDHEKSVTWEGPYGAAKLRTDGCNEDLFFDLKTTSMIERRRFASQFFSLGYNLQFGWYQEGLKVKRAYAIALESDPPFDCVVYRVPDVIVDNGRAEAIQIAMRYRCCEVTRCWPGVADDGIVDLEAPKWASESTETDMSTGTMEASEL